jgi:hypothetical protein
MTKPTRTKREQMESRPRNHIEEQDDADQLEPETELNFLAVEATDEPYGIESDEEEDAESGEEPES